MTKDANGRPKSRDSRTGKLVRVLIINGECSRAALTEFYGGDPHETSKVLYRNQDSFVTLTLKKDGSEGEKKSKETKFFPTAHAGEIIRPKILRSQDNSPFEKLVYRIDKSGNAWNYFNENVWKAGKLRSAKRNVFRNTNISDVLLKLMDIYNIDCWDRPTLTELAEQKNIPINTFFASREVKAFTSVGKRELSNSVSIGALATVNGVFSVYQMKKEPNMSTWSQEFEKKVPNELKTETPEEKEKKAWSVGMETRMQVLVSKIFREGGYQYIEKGVYRSRKDDVMIFGTNEIAQSIFNGFYFPRSKTAIHMPKSVGRVVYIPDDKTAMEPLTLLSIPNMHDKIRDYVFQDSKIYKNSITEDGVLGKRDSLLWLDNDLARLSLALKKTDRQVKELQILCLESQAKLIEEIAKTYKNEEIVLFISTIRFEDALEIAEG